MKISFRDAVVYNRCEEITQSGLIQSAVFSAQSPASNPVAAATNVD